MSYRINLIPSEHSFEAELSETVLEAALRSGVNLGYSCNSGSCGDCMATIVSGDYEVVQHFDFVITEADKLQQKNLLCSIAPRSDMIIEASEAVSAQDIPQQHITVKVAKLERIADRYMVLHVRAPRSKSLRFLAGQSVKLSTGAGLSKQLAVASCPCNGMVLQFHLDTNEQDSFTRYVFDEMRTSESLELEGPVGEVTLDEESPRSSVMVAQGTGFAPMKSLIEHAIALDRPQSMQLFWIGNDAASFYQSNYCRMWEDAFDVFVYVPLVFNGGDEASIASVEEVENLVQRVIARSPIESEMDLYLSCSADISDAMEYAFLDRGTPSSRIFRVS